MKLNQGELKIGQTEVMKFMEQMIIATKQQIVDGTGINSNSKAISKCVRHHELDIMKIPKNGCITYQYYIFSEFKL